MTEILTARVRALLVDDHALFRESVVRALSAEPDFDITDCGGIQEALQIIARTAIDIVLLDHDLGVERANQFLPAAREIGYAGRVLVVTAGITDLEGRRLLRQGVNGIFGKENSLSALADGLRTVAGGGTWLDGRYAKLSEAGLDDSTQEPAKFNDRQRRVLRFVFEGLSNKEIAWRLQISETYVKRIVQSLFQKTGVRTRGQLVRVVLEQYEDQLRDD